MVARRRRGDTRASDGAAAGHHNSRKPLSAGVDIKLTGIRFARRRSGLGGHRSGRQHDDERAAKGARTAGAGIDHKRDV